MTKKTPEKRERKRKREKAIGELKKEMAIRLEKTPKKKRAKKPLKRDLWLKHYLNQDNPKTFLNGTESARVAGYKAKSDNAFRVIGSENLTKLKDKIEKWLDEEGLSDAALKKKLVSLIDAKKTKFFQKDGIVTQMIDVDALDIQRQSLDMAMKVKGMYAAEVIDVDLKLIPMSVKEKLLYDKLADELEHVEIKKSLVGPKGDEND